MKKTSSMIAVAALMAALGAGSLSLIPASAYAAEAEKPAQPATEAVRPEIAKPLNEAQELIGKKEYKDALAKIDALEAVPNKTPYEIFLMHRFRALIASATQDNALLAKSFEGMINSGRLSDADVLKFTEGMAGTYYNAKDYANARIWIERYIARDPNKEEMNALLARAMYLQGDYANAAKKINDLLVADEAAKRTPSEETLRLLGSSYQQLKDKDGYRKVLERMVAAHPSKEYWQDLLYQTETRPGFADRLRLDMYRLYYATNTIDEGPRYMEMVQLLQQAGFPAEAKKVIDRAYAENMMGTGKEAAAQNKLKTQVYKQAADDTKSLSAGEAEAMKAKTGVGLVNIGYNYVVNGQYDKGIPMIEQGIAKGGLKAPEDAKLHLGMAYLQSGNRDKAAEVFKSITATDGDADIGRIWLLVK